MQANKKIRVLIAKLGLDGHDNGAKNVALELRNAGMEVIDSGEHQTLDQILATAIQESVDVIELDIMSGAHIPISGKFMEMMKDEKLEKTHLTVGGVIPRHDVSRLRDMGVAEVFPNGTSYDNIIFSLEKLFE